MYFSINFFLEGEAKGKKKPIHAIVRKTGMKRLKRSTGIFIEPDRWNGGWVKPRNPENTKIKRQLERIQKDMGDW